MNIRDSTTGCSQMSSHTSGVLRIRKTNNNFQFSTLNILTYLFIYKVVIELTYAFLISPLYGYSGLTLNPNWTACLMSLAFLAIMVSASPKDKYRPSTYLFIILEVFLFTPTLSYFWLNSQSLVYTLFILLSSIVICVILRVKPCNFELKIRYTSIWFSCLFLVYIIVVIYLVVQNGGIDTRAFNFDSIYDMRSENNVSGIIGYLLNWSAKLFCPLFFAYFYFRKKYFLLLPILIFQLLLYLSYGNKAFLFSILLIVMVIYFVKRNKFDRDFILSIAAINIVAYMLDAYNISDALRRAIPYRAIFIPAQIQYHYYEFFSMRSKMHFSDSLIGKVFSIDSPFSEGYTFVIGQIYSGGGNANAGIFADAYANGGFICMICFAVIIALIFYLVDSITDKTPLYVVIGSFSYMMFVLNDTSLQTALLTGGMGMMILLLLLLNFNLKADNYNINSIKAIN